MEDAIHEADAGALVGVLVGELDVNLPEAALEGCCDGAQYVVSCCNTCVCV